MVQTLPEGYCKSERIQETTSFADQGGLIHSGICLFNVTDLEFNLSLSRVTDLNSVCVYSSLRILNLICFCSVLRICNLICFCSVLRICNLICVCSVIRIWNIICVCSMLRMLIWLFCVKDLIGFILCMNFYLLLCYDFLVFFCVLKIYLTSVLALIGE